MQDAAAILRSRNTWIVAIADGVGGMPGGAYAASLVIDRVRAAAGSDDFELASALSWQRLLLALDVEIARNDKSGETTALVVAVTATNVVGASCGDSEAWIISPETIHDLTERQQRKPRVGSGMAVPIPFESRALPGTLVAASDGLFHYAPAAQIATTVRQSQSCTAQSISLLLRNLVQLPSGEYSDDVTIAVLKIGP